jgi:hypothetical protein
VKRLWLILAAFLMLSMAVSAWAAGPMQDQGKSKYLYGTPPRFQIFTAPNPYGGLLMLDTQTGISYQRVIINTPQGIEIRWLKLKMLDSIPPGQTILWN